MSIGLKIIRGADSLPALMHCQCGISSSGPPFWTAIGLKS